MKVRKAIIPAAGLGTRVLPASKAIPKEMINIVDKPSIQYIVEECVCAGITDIAIILSRGKTIIEDHFDRSPELESKLISTNNISALETILNISSDANIVYIRQSEQRGLGDAVLRAEQFIGNEPFAVLYGDDVIRSEKPVIGQMNDIFDKYGKCIVGMQAVSDEMIVRCGSLAIKNIKDNIYDITDMIEKPKREDVLSNYAILGRCILTPDIFDKIKKISKLQFETRSAKEIQLTDAIKEKITQDGVMGFEFDGRRYDMGNKLEIIKANIEMALCRPEFEPELKAYLKDLNKKISKKTKK